MYSSRPLLKSSLSLLGLTNGFDELSRRDATKLAMAEARFPVMAFVTYLWLGPRVCYSPVLTLRYRRTCWMS